MRTIARSARIVLLGLWLPAGVVGVGASQEREVAPQGGRGPMGLSGVAILQALDADHDNVLSAEEVANAPAALKRLDRNTDGRLTADEIPMMGRGGRDGGRGRGEAGRGGEGARGGEGEARPTSADDLVAALMGFDENKDGKLAKAELPERYQGLFDRGDANKDGFLTAAELKVVAAAQAPPANVRTEGGREGRGEGEGRGRPPGAPGMADALVAALDVNHDGVLTLDEIGGASVVLRKFDKNGDGRVTFEEIFGEGRGRGGFDQ